METHPQVVAFIAQLREDHHRLGKEKIKPLLDAFCREEGVPTISTSTIGNVIKRHRLFSSPQRRIYHNPGSGFAGKKRIFKAKIKHSPRPEGSGYLEIDTITRLVHGIRFYIFNAILNWNAAPSTTITWAAGQIDDCRRIFRPLTNQKICCTYNVGDGRTSHGDFDSIEEALQHLPASGGEICLLPGLHQTNAVIDGDRKSVV